MLDAIKGIFGSKKALLAMIGSAIVGVLYHFQVPQEIITMVGTLFGVTIGAQGLADLGKGAKKTQ